MSYENTELIATTALSATTVPRVREIHKSGWLIRLPPTEKKGGVAPFSKQVKKLPEKFWAVFCIHDDAEAFLEFYSDHENSCAHKPSTYLRMGSCLHISPCIMCEEQLHTFAVTLDSSVVRLAALTREQMMEWIEVMRNKLRDLTVLEPNENIYSKEPEIRPPLAPNRDPTSPLPPTPGVAALPPGTVSSSYSAAESVISALLPQQPLAPLTPLETEVRQQQLTVSNDNYNNTENQQHVAIRRHPPLSNSNAGNRNAIQSNLRHSSPMAPTLSAAAVVPLQPTILMPSSAPIVSGSTTTNVFNFDVALAALGASADVPSSPYHQSSYQVLPNDGQSDSESSLYEPLHLAHTPTFIVPFGSTGITQQQSRDSSVDTQTQDNSTRPSIHNNGSSSAPTGPISLKLAQVLQLQKEISHPGGVRIRLRHKDCLSSIAFVDFMGAIWIVGWKQKERPLLHNSFHIGDRLMSIGGHQMLNSHEAQRTLKQMPPPFVEFVVARAPYGKTFAIKRDYEGQDLGLIRENNTAEIKEVLPDGLAARHGLSLQAVSPCGNNLCSWMLSEINGRPLNLFFKDNEIHDRLNAVGKDISILVQPSDFVKTLKKQLKSIRNYKDYIVQ